MCILASCRVCVCVYACVRALMSHTRLQLNYVAMAILRKRSQFMIYSRNIAFVRGARDDYVFMSLVLFIISTTWFNDIDNNHSILSGYP